MQPFESVTFSYKGKTYTVQPEAVWGLISTIENIISRMKLAMRIAQNDVPELKVAEAYAAALRYAGAGKVDATEILHEMEFMDVIKTAKELFFILSMASKPVTIADKEVAHSGDEVPPKEEPTKV